MRLFRKGTSERGVMWIISRGLQGAVDGGFTEYRLGEPIGGRDLSNPKNLVREDDWYGAGSATVSIETAAEREDTIQRKIDRAVEQENLGFEDVEKGLPPCKRLKKEGQQ